LDVNNKYQGVFTNLSVMTNVMNVKRKLQLDLIKV
jgi:hypothetical protein